MVSYRVVKRLFGNEELHVNFDLETRRKANT
jgi:hypothetical protein